MELNKYCKEKLNFLMKKKEALNATDATKKDVKEAWLKG
jgi:hypothetical protein